MPDALEDFTRQAIDDLLKELPPERLLKQVPVADRFKGLTADQVLAVLPNEVRLALSARLRQEEPGHADDA